MEDDFNSLKRYRLLIALVLILLTLVASYWLIKKYSTNSPNVYKDEVIQKLNRHKR